MWKRVIFTLTILVAYRLYTPVPDDMGNKWQYRGMYAVKTVFDGVMSIQTLLNGKPYFANYRNLMDLAAPAIQERTEGSNIRVTEANFDGVKVLLYQPIKRGPELSAGLIYYHGGGFTTKFYHELTLQFAEELDIVVVSVEYRLPPENPFPAAYEDSLAATKRFLGHRQEYKVDPTRVAAAGDSSGGRLTAALMIGLRDETSRPKVKIQGLINPTLQSLDQNTPSMQLYKKNWGNGGLLNVKDSAMYTSLYIFGKIDDDFIEAMMAGQLVPLNFRKTDVRYSKYISHDLIPENMKNTSFYEKPAPPRYVDDTLWKRHKDTLLDFKYAPLMAHDLSNLPKAYILTCEHDTFRDDGIMYYKRLQEVGVDVKWVNYQGGYHGMFPLIGDYSVAKTALAEFIDYLRKHL